MIAEQALGPTSVRTVLDPKKIGKAFCWVLGRVSSHCLQYQSFGELQDLRSLRPKAQKVLTAGWCQKQMVRKAGVVWAGLGSLIPRENH